jgi:hypothetical protein
LEPHQRKRTPDRAHGRAEEEQAAMDKKTVGECLGPASNIGKGFKPEGK